MYSPYDINQQTINWEDTSSYLLPGKVLAGMGAIATAGIGLGTAAVSTRLIHNRLMKKDLKYASFINKMRGSKLYKTTTNPFLALSMYSPGGFRDVNRFDKFFYSIFNRDPKTIGKMFRSPLLFGGVLSALSISSEFDSRNHPSALPIGIAREATSILGSVLGSGVGWAVGSLVLPGPGTLIGSLVGSALGYAAGSMVPEAIGFLKAKGREWTLPDVGGSFHDSKMSMTMR